MGETFFDGMRQIESASLSSGEKFLLIVLLRCGGANGEAWPSHETLARWLSATPRAIRNWQHRLVSAGALVVQSGGGRGSSNRYRVDLSKLPVNPEPRSAFTESGSAENPEPRSAFEGAVEHENPEPRSAHPGTTFLPPRNHVPPKGNRKETERKESRARPKFVKPTLAEVAAYFAELGAPDCAAKFFNHFEAIGWRMGRHRMADWKPRARQWVLDEPAFSRSPRGAAGSAVGSAAGEKAFDKFVTALKKFSKYKMPEIRGQFEESEWPVVWKAVTAAGGSDAIANRPADVRGRFVATYDTLLKGGAR